MNLSRMERRVSGLESSATRLRSVKISRTRSSRRFSDALPLARRDLVAYAQLMWPRFELSSHHRYIADQLQAVADGKIQRMIICMPPRHGKSLLASQTFPAFLLGKHPDRQIITATYGQELSDYFGRQVLSLVSDPLHLRIFPKCRVAVDAASKKRFLTTAGGSYVAVGRGGAVTGRGADLLLLDDLIKDAEEARSESIRRMIFDRYQFVARTRLQPGGAIILISTRWHEDDLAGRLLREPGGEEWQLLSLPAIAEEDEIFRRAGQALWPEKYPLEDLERTRRDVGSAAWASLYQQRPAAAEGAIFKREWWRYFDQQPVCTRIVASWDTAFKTGSENDFSACSIWGINQVGYFLLWFWRGRVEFPHLKRQMCMLAEQWHPHQILVEDKASGQSLIQELQYESRLPIIPIKVDRDKLARAQAVTPLIEAGKVFLPRDAPWLAGYVDELAAFPAGNHDDGVDSTVQALNYVRHQPLYTVSFSTVRL